ncbi:MAG: hypothetical protein WC979_02290 [Candidatus Pacearchaeota archaeon]|jgi:hypothetical protein|nr:hypothetical protein [Clostridia bacterium]
MAKINEHIESQFVTKEIAKEVVALGFDKQCFAYFKGKVPTPIDTDYVSFRGLSDGLTPAPLWQQVREWFLEKYSLNVCAEPIYINVAIGSCSLCGYCPKVGNIDFTEEYDSYYAAREHAVLTAIKRLKRNV